MKLDCTRAYDGQGAFRNGLHDAIRCPHERRLYRPGHPWAWLNHLLWSLGRWLGSRRMVGLLIVTLLGACTNQQRAETVRARNVFECEVDALTPYLPDAVDAAQLVRDVVTGRAELDTTLIRLGASVEQANKALTEFNVCFAGVDALPQSPGGAPVLVPKPLPESVSSRLIAPPPAWGNRVL